MKQEPSPAEQQIELLHQIHRKQAHNLNNCIASVLGMATLLSDHLSDEERENVEAFLSKLREAAHKALDASQILKEAQAKMYQLTLGEGESEEDDFIIPMSPLQAEAGEPMEESLHDPCETILLVEDDMLYASVLHEYLTGFGYEVLLAQDGLQAIELVQKQHHELDIACIDYQIPKKDGFEVARALREVRPTMRIMLMSGYSINPEHPTVKALRFSHVLIKPIELPMLARLIRKTLDEPVVLE